MTGNVAQVFVTDEAWRDALQGVHHVLSPQGRFVFEVRNPEQRAWLNWSKEETFVHKEIVGVGRVNAWCEVMDAKGSLVAFRWTFEFERDGAVLTSDSVLRFRSRSEIERSLESERFLVEDVLDAPDRPGKELVFVARRA